MVSWNLNAKFSLFVSASFWIEKQSYLLWPECLKPKPVLFHLQTVTLWTLKAMRKRCHPDRCWVSNEVSWDQCLLSTYQYLFPNDQKAFLCSAVTQNSYNIYNGKWKVLAMWLEKAPAGMCNYCCTALLAVCSVLRYTIFFAAKLIGLQSCCYLCPKVTQVFQ